MAIRTLTEAQRQEIYRLLQPHRDGQRVTQLSDAEIARRVGVSRATVSRIRRRLEWLAPRDDPQAQKTAAAEAAEKPQDAKPVAGPSDDPPPGGSVTGSGSLTTTVISLQSMTGPGGGGESADAVSNDMPAQDRPALGTENTGRVTHHTSNDIQAQGDQGSDPQISHQMGQLTDDRPTTGNHAVSGDGSRYPTASRAAAPEEQPRPVSSVTSDDFAGHSAPTDILAALLEALDRATPEEVDRLRRRLLTPPEVSLPEKRKVPRRTYAWYLAEELGEAVKARARREGVPPSEVAERVLWQAKAAGWL